MHPPKTSRPYKNRSVSPRPTDKLSVTPRSLAYQDFLEDVGDQDDFTDVQRHCDVFLRSRGLPCSVARWGIWGVIWQDDVRNDKIAKRRDAGSHDNH